MAVISSTPASNPSLAELFVLDLLEQPVHLVELMLAELLACDRTGAGSIRHARSASRRRWSAARRYTIRLSRLPQ
jgi:hypothetical protein